MRILNLIPSLAGGGAESQLGYLAPELVRMGHEAHVAYVTGRGVEDRFSAAGVKLHKLRARGNYDPVLPIQILRLARSLEPDVFHTWILQMDILGGIAARITGTPWLLREPSTAARYSGGLKNRLRVWAGSRATAVVSNSPGGDAYWRARVPDSRRFVIPNGIPLDLIDPVEPRGLELFGRDAGEPFVMYAGRLEPGKNVLTLLDALAAVMAKQPVTALLCGEGSQRAVIEDRARDLGISDRVLLPGYTESVWSLMKGAKAFVFVSSFEGFPNSVAEALACGCPSVLSNIPAHRQLADETLASFVPPDDPDAISSALLELLADSDTARRRAELARERAREWSVESMASSYEQVYSNIAGK